LRRLAAGVSAEPRFRPALYVLAGVNGAGKSSIAGARFRARGGDYFDPDEATEAILRKNPGASRADANSAAWQEGVRLLRRAIDERLSFAVETTLGGKTIPALIRSAAEADLQVRVWYVGLEGPELHIARVRARVALGGHDVPEARIRERYHGSRANLVRLLPHLAELRLWDNSAEADPARGFTPDPRLILHLREGRITSLCPLADVTHWAKPIVLTVLGRA